MAVTVHQEKCTGCGICVDICPLEAISVVENLAKISEDCTDCGICTDECPDEALALPS